MWISATRMWLCLCLLAVAGGALREKVLAPRLGELRSRQAETLAFIPVVFGLTCWWIKAADLAASPHLAGVGLYWLALTVAFEFGFGRLVMRHPWSRLLADYNLFRGRLWSLFLAALALSPSLAGRLLAP